MSSLAEVQISRWGQHLSSRTWLDSSTRGCSASRAGAGVWEKHLPDRECPRLCVSFTHLPYEGKSLLTYSSNFSPCSISYSIQASLCLISNMHKHCVTDSFTMQHPNTHSNSLYFPYIFPFECNAILIVLHFHLVFFLIFSCSVSLISCPLGVSTFVLSW